MQRRALLSLTASAAALSLAGCGFQLRKAPDYAFTTLFSGLPESSPLGVELRRSLESTRKVKVITDGRQIKDAQVILDVLGDQREKQVLSRNASGQVREFQLRMRFRFKLRTLAGKELIPETEILQQRDISFNESAVLAKEAEENLLYRDMQSDIVQQVLRRLAAVTEI
ncbi:LPS assembly lipoprotein LptE [Polaromonas sp. JS666]|uniref:LPS-assembly lipoprotein LptE n=1 Tax=Polaromonas sp. (strain JS666 / ATCC BAA-500) TaxID=296591 RepID=UPI0000463E08|nr:LPS assembly lipoprotein LptE [Polaromonas sp. JS666]ABE46487.1 rare lipoprotein B [Polaromonas sp. JS666]